MSDINNICQILIHMSDINTHMSDINTHITDINNTSRKQRGHEQQHDHVTHK